MGDLTSLIEVIKRTKKLQRHHEWSYSATEAVKLRTKLEDIVHKSVKRAQQCEADGLWREAEYLWGSIKYYASADRPREVKNALMEVEFHPSKYNNKLIGLFPLVALHERLGDFPRAEHDLELLIARLHDHPDAEPRQSTLDSEIKTLIRLYKMFQERVAGYEVTGLEKKTLVELSSLSLLFRVSALDCVEIYVALLGSNASIFPTPGEWPKFLHLSASMGSKSFMTLLLSAGIKIDSLDHHNRTALHIAAREGHEDVVKLLVSSGAAANLQDEDDYSPLHYACLEGHIAVSTILLGNGASVQARTDEDEDGFTPLHMAIKSGSLDLVQLLLAYGCGMKEKTNVGKTVLHLAAGEGNEVLVKLSLDSGVEKDSADNYGIRPIHDAANAAVARLLLDAGADPHSPEIFDETPLLSAAWRDDVEVVKLLLEHKANVDAQDDQGRTALHRAVSCKRVEIVSTLLRNAANINLQDIEGKTPLHEALRSGDVDIVVALLEYGAEPHFLDILRKSRLNSATGSREEETLMAAREKLNSKHT
jgi:ankyrin repeat protein